MKKIATFTTQTTMDGRYYYGDKILLFATRELAEKARKRFIEKTGTAFMSYSEITELEICESEDEIDSLRY